MNETLLPELFCALNLAVIARQPNHTYIMVTPAPQWLSGAFAHAPVGERNTLAGAFAFLDDFLQQANGAWDAGPHASIVSGPFSATVDGDEMLLRASALTVGGQALLVLERLVGAADSRVMLQKARQHVLDGEQLARQAARVHAPAAAIAQAVTMLRGTTLSPDQQRVVDQLAQASDDLGTAAAALPGPTGARKPAQR